MKMESVLVDISLIRIYFLYAFTRQGFGLFRDHLAPSLKGVTFETRPAEKIGVVGRTGAGKTSLLASLFRIGEITSGSITIDSVNVAHISIRALR